MNLDIFAETIFGMLIKNALIQGICINYKQPFNLHPNITLKNQEPTEAEKNTQGVVWTDSGYKKLKISGLCEYCFTKIVYDDEFEDEEA